MAYSVGDTIRYRSSRVDHQGITVTSEIRLAKVIKVVPDDAGVAYLALWKSKRVIVLDDWIVESKEGM